MTETEEDIFSESDTGNTQTDNPSVGHENVKSPQIQELIQEIRNNPNVESFEGNTLILVDTRNDIYKIMSLLKGFQEQTKAKITLSLGEKKDLGEPHQFQQSPESPFEYAGAFSETLSSELANLNSTNVGNDQTKTQAEITKTIEQKSRKIAEKLLVALQEFLR